MKIAFNCLAAAAFMMAGAAHAGVVTVDVATNTYNGLKLSGFETLVLSADLLGVLDTGRMGAQSSGGIETSIVKDADGYYVAAQAKTPITSLTIEDTISQVQSATARGGLTITSSFLKSVSSGGSLTITDLQVDLTNKKVYATLIGGNGVGTLNHYYLWDITGPLASANITANGTGPIVASGLSATTDAYNQIVKSLGLQTLGKAALSGVVDYGFISVKVDSKSDDSGIPTPPPPPPTCAVSYKTTNVSSTTFDATVTISNSSTNTASDWQINWTYGAPTLVLKVKSVNLTNTNSTKLKATPASTNKVIPAGSSATFSFRAYSASAPPAVSGMTATLGGQNCSVSTQ